MNRGAVMSSKVRKIEIPSVKAGFLKNVFNPNDLLAQPGIYTTYSNTEAYPILLAMMNTGLVEHITTEFIDSTIQQPIVRVKNRKMNGKTYKKNPEEGGKSISIPFKVSKQVISGDQALRTYGRGWKKVWWREAIQNSKDAKATIIDCGAVEQEDGNWLIWTEDNGRGMDLQTLVDSFLALGGTGGKTESGENVGGFGKAKEILLLPWIHFRVHTRDNIAYSDRSTRTGEKFADITTGNKKLSGTRLEVLMPPGPEDHTDISQLLAFLRLCNTPGVAYNITGKFTSDVVETKTVRANLTTGKATSFSIGDEEQPASYSINGRYEKFTVQEDGTVKTEIINDAHLATVYMRKQTKPPLGNQQLLVRDRGVFMFGEWVNPRFAEKLIAFVELEVPSKFVLTENRDGWRNSTLQREISAFIDQVSKKQDRLFEEKSKLFFKKFYGEGGFQAERKRKRQSEMNAAEVILAIGTPAMKGNEFVIDSETESEIDKTFNDFTPPEGMDANEADIATTSSQTAIAMIKGTRITGADQLNNIIKQAMWKPNFGVINEIKGQQPPKKYFPADMTPGVLRLAKYWTEFVKWVLGQLGVFEEFNVGFVFTKKAQAMYSVSPNPVTGVEEKWILLNPILLKPETAKKEKWITTGQLMKVSSEDDLKLLYAAAIHECTHMETGLGDDELDFPVALTYNIARTAGFRDVKKIAKTIVTSAMSTERKDRPGSSVPSTKAGYGDLFYVEQQGKGRPKVIKTFGVPSEIQFRYMWEGSPADGWDGLDCRLEMIVENNVIYSDKANMGDFLDTLFKNWWDIRYGGADKIDVLPKIDLTSENDRITMHNYSTAEMAEVDIRSFILVINQMVEEVISKRINFIVSQTKNRDARALRDEWKRVRG